MTLAVNMAAAARPVEASGTAVRKPRDIRLDFFRGIGMFIILIAHIPGNTWAAFIPARFGFSDATEIFVFCSGMASAIAFGRLFEQQGLAMGSSRIAFRCWQVYWAHIAIFFMVTASMVLADRLLESGGYYVGQLNLVPFLSGNTGENLVGLLTLSYVPNYFDILPMYLVILTMIPVVMALRLAGRVYVLAFVGGVWLLGTTATLNLPAEPWSDRVWFFNPFAWQLVFFTGFAFMAKWIPAPPVDRRLVIAAVVFVVATIPPASWYFLTEFEWARNWREAWMPLIDKTGFGILRFVHFLALAYLAFVFAGPNGDNLRALKGSVVEVTCKVGQQALGVFLAGQLLAVLAGVYLNELGVTVFNLTLVNIGGCLALVAVAYIAAYFKSAPWSVKPKGAGAVLSPTVRPAEREDADRGRQRGLAAR